MHDPQNVSEEYGKHFPKWIFWNPWEYKKKPRKKNDKHFIENKKVMHKKQEKTISNCECGSMKKIQLKIPC